VMQRHHPLKAKAGG